MACLRFVGTHVLVFVHTVLKVASSVLLASSVLTQVPASASSVSLACPNVSFDQLIQSARSASHVVIPEGCVVYQHDVVTVDQNNIHITGGGTVVALNPLRSNVFLKGDRITVSSLTFELADQVIRQDSYEQMRIRVAGSHNKVVSVTVDRSAAAGIYVGEAAHFKLVDNTVSGTNADGIHITEGSVKGSVVGNRVVSSGDDGVAVVSYDNGRDRPVKQVVIKDNVVSDQVWGRAFSVVGGLNIFLFDNKSVSSAGAALYIAAESEYGTFGVDGVTVDGFVAVRSNQQNRSVSAFRPSPNKPVVWHGAVHLYDSSVSGNIKNVKIRRLHVSKTATRAPDVVARVYNGDVLKNCSVSSDRKLSVSFQRFSSSGVKLKVPPKVSVRSKFH